MSGEGTKTEGLSLELRGAPRTMVVRAKKAGAYLASFALHAVLVLALLRMALPHVTSPIPARQQAVTVVEAPAEDARYPGLKPVASSPDDRTFESAVAAPRLSIDTFTFDVSRIATRAKVLFPFISPGLSLDLFGLTPPRAVNEPLRSPFIEDKAHPSRPANAQPLVLSASALQATVDHAWSRRDRWRAFQPVATLIKAHSPDVGAAPLLLQRYEAEDALQPYGDNLTRDGRLWAELDVASDQADFIAFIRTYAAAHPSTKATTELLFLLDDLAQSNRNLLATLLQTNAPAQLARTRALSPEAYSLVTALQSHYHAELNAEGLDTDVAVTAYYDRVRLQILDGIVRSTPDGYRANDARFLIGVIQWKSGQMGAAAQEWEQMTLDRGDTHAATSAAILDVLRSAGVAGTSGGGRIPIAMTNSIDRILAQDDSQWLTFSFDRLAAFGYTFNTF